MVPLRSLFSKPRATEHRGQKNVKGETCASEQICDRSLTRRNSSASASSRTYRSKVAQLGWNAPCQIVIAKSKVNWEWSKSKSGSRSHQLGREADVTHRYSLTGLTRKGLCLILLCS